ncbi:hypothetical protein HPB50_022447 [Hyalomma asiaticum]|uniref:Uncharacterized protein n=1 Tax=Hyalomma asiaticum TaxID=266040 RepID=A0ACB7TNU9_HYAAI|nr:hypothetical protein HPB50_022447 [Hyalomma asiaticum]
MASGECRKKLKPAPPSPHIRERSRSRQRHQGQNSSEPSSSMLPCPSSRLCSPGRDPNMQTPSAEHSGCQGKIGWSQVTLNGRGSETTDRDASLACSSRENDDLKRKLEEHEKREKARESILERKLDLLMLQMEQQSKSPTTPQPPLPPPPPSIQTATLDVLQALEKKFEGRLGITMEAVITEVTEMMQTMVQSLKLDVAHMGEGLSQRVVALERNK